MMFRRILAAAAILFLTGVAGTALAASCSCSYSEPQCSCAITCPGQTNCSCTTNGCLATCGSASGGMELGRTTNNFTSVSSAVNGLADWHAGLPSDTTNWTMSFTISSTQRKTVTWTDKTFQQLLDAWAAEFGGCVEIDSSAMTIAFQPAGTCD